MIRLAFASLVLILVAAETYPIIENASNCPVGKKFIRQENSPFVYDCVKFGRSVNAKFAGCSLGGKLVPLDGAGEEVYKDQHYGYRYQCTQDDKGYFRIPITACIIDGKNVEIGQTGTYIDTKNDLGYLWGCRKNDKGVVQITREGCYLAPETSDEVFLKVNETKHIPPLEQYCKCAYNGYGVVCFNRLDNLSAY